MIGRRPSVEVARGLSAVAKSLLVLAGVPLTLLRLWLLAPDPGRLFSRVPASVVVAHGGFVAVGALWAYCALSLVMDVRAALRDREHALASTWSTRWASAIAGLVLLVMTSGAIDPGSHHGTGAGDVRAAAAAPATADDPGDQTPQGPVTTVLPGECLADVAERVTGSRHDWAAIARINAHLLQADGGLLVDPNLLRPGWCLVLPASTQGAPGADVTRQAADSTPDDRTVPSRLEELGLLGLGVLTTAALARRLGVLGRMTACLRAPGARRIPATEEVGSLEASIGPLGDSTLIDWIEVANRVLTAVAPDDPTPDIRMVRAGVDGIAFLLATPIDPAPAPFRARAAGRWWLLTYEHPLATVAAMAGDCGRFVPGLVPVGDDDDAVVLLAIGPGRHLVIDAAEPQRRAALDAVTVALRTLPWAEELEVELLGVEPPPASQRCYQMLESTEATLLELSRLQRPARTTLRPSWRREPLVMIGTRVTDEVLHAVNDVAGVIGGEGTATERLVIGPEGARLEPYGVGLAVPTPDASQLRLVERLFERAVTFQEVVPFPAAAAPAQSDSGSTVVLELLRPCPRLVAAESSVAPGDRDRVTELVAYLLLHGRHSDLATLAVALYPGSATSRATERTARLALAARGALGFGEDDAPLLGMRPDGTVVLHENATSDWHRFLALVANARSSTPAPALELLREALDLVAGKPLSQLRSGYRWLVAEGTDEAVNAEVLDVAHHVALLAVAADEDEVARHAIAAGRGVEPASEVLVRDLMVLHDRAGRHAELVGVYETLEATLDSQFGVESSTETRALFEELRRHPS